MGDFTSQYKVTDSNGVSRTETRIDAGKSIDAFAVFLMIILFITIGLIYSGFLWLIFKTLKEPDVVKFKEMQQHGIDNTVILAIKKKAWIWIIVSILLIGTALSFNPPFAVAIAGFTFIFGYVLLFKTRKIINK